MTRVQSVRTAATLPPHLAAFFVSRPVHPAPRGSGFVPPRGVLAELAQRGGRG